MNQMHNYSIDKQRAIEQLLDMNKRATQNTKKHDKTRCTQHNGYNFSNSIMHLPFDQDTITILALMFILYNNSNDILLIFALAYILI